MCTILSRYKIICGIFTDIAPEIMELIRVDCYLIGSGIVDYLPILELPEEYSYLCGNGIVDSFLTRVDCSMLREDCIILP